MKEIMHHRDLGWRRLVGHPSVNRTEDKSSRRLTVVRADGVAIMSTDVGNISITSITKLHRYSAWRLYQQERYNHFSIPIACCSSNIKSIGKER